MTTPADFENKLLHCPALIAIKSISGKWKTRILWLLRSGEIQFNDLRRHLNGVSAKVLTEQLRQLEQDGIITHIILEQKNVRISQYSFSEYGATLIPVLDALGEWGLIHERLTVAGR